MADRETLVAVAALTWTLLVASVITVLAIFGEWTAAEIALGIWFAISLLIGTGIGVAYLWRESRAAWRKESR